MLFFAHSRCRRRAGRFERRRRRAAADELASGDGLVPRAALGPALSPTVLVRAARAATSSRALQPEPHGRGLRARLSGLSTESRASFLASSSGRSRAYSWTHRAQGCPPGVAELENVTADLHLPPSGQTSDTRLGTTYLGSFFGNAHRGSPFGVDATLAFVCALAVVCAAVQPPATATASRRLPPQVFRLRGVDGPLSRASDQYR